MNPDDILDRFNDLIDALDGREIPDDIVLMEQFRDDFRRLREERDTANRRSLAHEAEVARLRALLARIDAWCKAVFDVNVRSRDEMTYTDGLLDAAEAIHGILAGETWGCQVCHGQKGGAPGNEQWVDGKLVCDYCHAAMRPAGVPPEETLS